jgi:organic radical activating enzyme
MCDTDYTVERWFSTPFALVQLVRQALPPGELVVITGGEPFRQNIEALVGLLIEYSYSVQIETNGTLPPPSVGFSELCSLDPSEPYKCFIVCSPKTGKVNEQLKHLIGAYKYVLSWGDVLSDGLPQHALDHSARPHVARPHQEFKGPVYVQPCDAKDAVINSRNLEVCVRSVMQKGFTLQLQIHKIIGAE